MAWDFFRRERVLESIEKLLCIFKHGRSQRLKPVWNLPRPNEIAFVIAHVTREFVATLNLQKQIIKIYKSTVTGLRRRYKLVLLCLTISLWYYHLSDHMWSYQPQNHRALSFSPPHSTFHVSKAQRKTSPASSFSMAPQTARQQMIPYLDHGVLKYAPAQVGNFTAHPNNSDLVSLLHNSSSIANGINDEEDDALQRFTVTGRPMPAYKPSALENLGMWNAPQFLPQRFTDDSVVPVVVILKEKADPLSTKAPSYAHPHFLSPSNTYIPLVVFPKISHFSHELVSCPHILFLAFRRRNKKGRDAFFW